MDFPVNDDLNTPCGSVEDLQGQLAGLFQTKVSETRAQHISTTFELRATVLFNLVVTDVENESLDALQFLDNNNSMGAFSDHNIPNGFIPRTVSALDCLMHQPQDDPVLQNIVSKHIINSISSIDLTSWIARQVSRAMQGWAFTYICNESTQAWTRQIGKVALPPLGECSSRKDPINEGRPAFDCRGSLIISFQKSSRVITVKYEHTPIHKTVADLLALHAPLPPLPSVPKIMAKAPAKRRAPASSAAPVGSAAGISEEAGAENGNGSTRKKQRRKENKASEAPIAPPDVEAHAYTDVNESIHADPKPNPHQQEDPAAIASGLINVAPEEAERRKDAAVKILTASGIDPNTLSADQFSIFSNQSPELQKESLDMLIKYGAERLRIVHPSRDVANSNANANANINGNNNTSSHSAGQASADTPKRRKKRQSVTATTPAAAPEAEPSPPVSVMNGQGKKTRGACTQCKRRKVICPLEKPACSNCVEMGVACEYGIAKTRKSRKLAAVVTGEDEADTSQNEVHAPTRGREPEPEPEPVHELEPASVPELEPAAATRETALAAPITNSASMFGGNQVSADTYQHSASLPYQTQPVSLGNSNASSSVVVDHTVDQQQPQQQPQQASASLSSQPKPRRPRRSWPSAPSRNQAPGQIATTTHQPQSNSSWQADSTSPISLPATETPPPSTASQVGMRTRGSAQNQQVPFGSSNFGCDAVQQTAVSSTHQSPVFPQAYCQSQTHAATTSQGQDNSRQGHRTGIPVAGQSASRPQQTATTSHPTTTKTSETVSLPSYGYGRHGGGSSNSGSVSGISNSRIAYEPYSHQLSASSTSNYSYNYNAQSTTNTASSSHNAALASEALSTASHLTASTQWPTSQARSSNADSSSSANAATTTSYATSSTKSQLHDNAAAATLSSTNVRPQATSHTRTSSRTSYNQQSQAQPQQQTRSAYSSQTPGGNMNQPQNWYGNLNSAINTTSYANGKNNNNDNNNNNNNNAATRSVASGYATGTSTNTNPTYHHGYQTRQMGISAPGYRTADGDNSAFYDMLRGNSGH